METWPVAVTVSTYDFEPVHAPLVVKTRLPAPAAPWVPFALNRAAVEGPVSVSVESSLPCHRIGLGFVDVDVSHAPSWSTS
jgi:hypothetical protein